MLNMQIDNIELTEQDQTMVNAVKQYIDLYPEDNLLTAWDECYSKCNFQHHSCGKGGNHIWITRQEDNNRILIITERKEGFTMEREEMTIDQEREFVNELFNGYEKEITEVFWTPYTDYENKIGQGFKIVRRLTEEDADLECLPMWKIKFEDGEEIDSYPEEITKELVEEYQKAHNKTK
jgi:hypothetical protein